MTRSAALRYALAPACVALAALLYLSPASAFLHPTGPFVIAVLAAAWFGGVGPGFAAAVLSTLALPQLVASSYPLVGGFFDLPRFITFTLIGLAVGLGATRSRRAEAALRRSEQDLEKKLTERAEALRESEQRYARAMEATEAGHWEWDLVGRQVFHSPRFRELYGVSPDEEFADREAWKARQPVSRAERERQEQALQAAIADPAKSYDIELSFEVRPGEIRWLRSRGKVFRDEDGRPLRIAGATTDITAQKLAQQALQESEQRYERAMEGSDAGHWDWNIVTDEMFVSQRAREMLALPPGPLPARRADLMALVPQHPDDQTRMDELVRAGVRTGIHERDYRVIPRPGELRWLRSRGKVNTDARGAAVRMTGSLTDITERKLAADALRQSEERYSLAMEASEEGHFDLDLDTDELFTSERLNEVYGFPPGTRFANRSAYLAQVHLHSDDVEKYQAALDAAVARHGPERYEFEFRIVRPSGEVRWLWTRGKVTQDAEGRARRRTGVVADITARKLAADGLRESEARFRALTELSSDAYWAQDENLRFIPTGAEYDLAGYPSDSHIGKTRWALSNATPLSSPWAEHEAVLQARKPFRDFEYRRPAPDGSVRYLSISGAPIFDAQGMFRGYQGVGRDITDRKRAEEKLRESEALKSAMFESALDCIISIDHNGRVIEFNPAAERTFGYRRAEVMGKELAELIVPPRLREQHRRGLARYLATGEGPILGTRIEMPAVRADGAEFPVELSVTRIPAEGAPLFTAYLRDITDRQRAAEELRESEARFRALTELSSDWYWRQDENLRFTYLSQQITDTTPYSREWVIGKTRWELPGITLLSSSWAEHQALLAARQPFRDLEYARVGRDGHKEYVSVSGAPIFDAQGVLRGYQGIGRNITERKRIEEELRSRQEMLELAQKSAQAVAFEWRIGADGPYHHRWSAELAAMYGVSPDAFDGSFARWKVLIHHDDWPAVEDAIKHALRTGDVDTEYRVVHADRSVHWLQAKGRMFFDDAGKPARMLGFMHDVTERRQAEEELKRLERQLRQAQRLEAMGTLAGGIAHDFNNILGAILGYGEMALRDAAKGSRLRRDLDSIITAGERGRALVDRVLAFSRSGVGERVSVHVEQVVREALDLLAAKLPSNVTLHAKLHAGRAAMLGDATQVHQVLMNLATNAIQAMPSGGTLRVSLDAVHVEAARAPTIGSLASGDYLVLEVADTGTGIAPELLDRIFDPFFTTKEVGTGTGLGLSLVHGIVTELGGAIDVASTPGAGSTFTVYVPRSGEALDSSQAEEPELPRGDGQRVLIVDDEEPLVRLATRTLEELGYAPTGFTSSAAALAAFRADPQRFDALITDERMPGMSGSALIREVRGIRSRMPIVLMSGYVGGAVAIGAREAGAEEVLKKPLSARDLATSLARVLEP